MPLFRKKPVVIEAVQLTWANWSEICHFVPAPWFKRGVWLDRKGNPRPEPEWGAGHDDSELGLLMQTLESQEFLARGGDWIIKGVSGEFYPCKPDIFAATYEPAN